MAMKTSHVAKNEINRQFRSYVPRKALLTDITYGSENKVRKKQTAKLTHLIFLAQSLFVWDRKNGQLWH